MCKLGISVRGWSLFLFYKSGKSFNPDLNNITVPHQINPFSTYTHFSQTAGKQFKESPINP